jgi:type IV secretion system protein VirB2
MKFHPAFFVSLFLLAAEPALDQSIDLSPIQTQLQSIVDALTDVFL